jgi:hypothetical protein
MKCPHCTAFIHVEEDRYANSDDSISPYWVTAMNCSNPQCRKAIIHLNRHLPKGDGSKKEVRRMLIYPKAVARKPLGAGIPSSFLEDYNEAIDVLPISPKASAAISRRCLQNILREAGGFRDRDLAKEIQLAIDSNSLPSHITESMDAIRNIGNFAAHPLKSTSTGEICNVEPGEAEWSVEVLELLFDFYFIQPELARAKRDALNAKLADLGKPPMK